MSRWGVFQEETLDPVAAQAVLDEDHYGPLQLVWITI